MPLCCITECIKIPNLGNLKKVYSISDAKGVTFPIRFLEYQDFEAYGKRANCLNNSHLKMLSAVVDWNNPKIKSKKNLYIAKMKGAYIAPSHLGTVFDHYQQLLFRAEVSGEPLFWPVNQRIKNFHVQNIKNLLRFKDQLIFIIG